MTEEWATQTFRFPTELQLLVDTLQYKPLWQFALEEINRDADKETNQTLSWGLTLTIFITTQDSYNPEKKRSVIHYFPVPPATYNEKSWMRWLLARIIDVETHEACEFFTLGNRKTFAPHHGPGNDPYTVFMLGTDEEVRTQYTGEIKEKENVAEIPKCASER